MAHSAGSEVEKLIMLLGRLPGLGPRSAKRASLALLKRRETLFLPLLDAMQKAAHAVRDCQSCGAFTSQDPCVICQDETRDKKLICVVEDDSSLWAMERIKDYKGHYHVLGGLMSAVEGVGPDDIRIQSLLLRFHHEPPSEIIMALPATIEGQTTAFFITERIKALSPQTRITQLARGVPVGGALDWLDDGTIAHALRTRR